MESVMTIFNMSESTTNSINNIANMIMIIGAVLALIGTMTVFWSSGIKEQFANDRIRDNKVKIEIAKEHAAKLTLEIEQAKIEQLQLKTQLAWRRLEKKQFEVIKSSLVGVNFPDIWVSFVKLDPESNLFRDDINLALTQLGIKTKYYAGYEMAVGLKIIGPKSKSKTKLVQAFKEAGLDFTIEDQNGFSNGQLQILVGSKPPIF